MTALRIVRFGAFEFDLRSRELRKRGLRIKIHGQPLDILALLLERPGDLVTRTELREKLWPANSFGDFDHSLNAAVKRLRRALGDSPDKPRYVETLARRGYRFIAGVQVAHAANGSAAHALVQSLAVLPFLNAGGDPDTEYLSDGVTESIIGSLAERSGLHVMARSTVFRYKGKDIDPCAVGRRLNVDAVLTGRIEQRGNSLIICAELVDVFNGSRIWGERYHRNAEDIFTVQEEISREISGKLHVKLGGAGANSAGARHSPDPQAYRAYLMGRYHWNKMTIEGLNKSVSCFEEAVAKDPQYALAYVGLADSLALFAFVGLSRPEQLMPKARAAVLKALNLDPLLADAHASFAGIRKAYEWDWADAERAYVRALELNPNYETAHRFYAAHLTALGRTDEALNEIRRAEELDPLSLIISMEAAWDLYMARQYLPARAQALRTLEMDSAFPSAHHVLGLISEQTGDYEDAVASFQTALSAAGPNPAGIASLAHLHGATGRRNEACVLIRELERFARDAYVPAYWFAIACAGLGEDDAALGHLERACDERDVWLVWLKTEPRFDRLRGHARFDRLLERVGLSA